MNGKKHVEATMLAPSNAFSVSYIVGLRKPFNFHRNIFMVTPGVSPSARLFSHRGSWPTVSPCDK